MSIVTLEELIKLCPELAEWEGSEQAVFWQQLHDLNDQIRIPHILLPKQSVYMCEGANFKSVEIQSRIFVPQEPSKPYDLYILYKIEGEQGSFSFQKEAPSLDEGSITSDGKQILFTDDSLRQYLVSYKETLTEQYNKTFQEIETAIQSIEQKRPQLPVLG